MSARRVLILKRLCVSFSLLLLAPGGVRPQALPPGDPVINGSSYQIPTGDTRPIYRFKEEAPGPVLAFWEAAGRDWRIHWDPLLETPHLLYPLGGEAIVAPGALSPEAPDLEELETSVVAFLEDHAEFIGVSSHDLTEPYIYPVGRSWVVVFGQTTPGGIPLRGANLRVVVRENGWLGWVKAFVARSCPDPEETLIEESEVLASAAAWDVTVLDARLQMSFPEEDSVTAVPTWSVEVAGADGRRSEVLLDARDGSVIVHRRVAKFFDGRGAGAAVEVRGTVEARVLDADDRRDTIQVDGVTIRDASGAVVGETSQGGEFTVLVPADTVEDGVTTITVALDSGSCVPSGSSCFGPDAEPDSAFHPLLEVHGGGALHPEERLDLDGDGRSDPVPALQRTGEASSPFRFTFNEGIEDPAELRERSWWFTSFEKGRNSLRFAKEAVSASRLAEPLFWPFDCLELLMLGTSTQLLDYQRASPCSSVFTSLELIQVDEDGEFVKDEEGRFVLEPAAPSLLLHEIGHHTFFHLTGALEAVRTELEEGVADAFAGMVQGNCRIGFLENGEATSRAFCLGLEDDEFRTQLRKDFGNGFWLLHKELRENFPGADVHPGEVTIGTKLLFRFLALNRVSEEDMRLFGHENNLIEQLLLLDDDPFFGGDGRLLNGSPHGLAILEVFRGRLFFEMPFRRGNANLDSRLDLADALHILNFLFSGNHRFHDCLNAMDTNNDSDVDLGDVVFLVNALFLEDVPVEGSDECDFDIEPPWKPENIGCRRSGCFMGETWEPR